MAAKSKSLPLAQWLEQGPFTLALSSSFFGFFAHAGAMAALDEAGFRPAKITGASAGALIGGAFASGLSGSEIRELLFSLRRQDFWDPAIGPGLLKGEKFLRLLETHYAPTFQAAKVPLEVAAFDLLAWKTRFLREGNLPKAVAASCAVPLLFRPVRIGRGLYMDGGVFLKSGVNPEHGGERVLSVFLPTKGIVGWYEGEGDAPELAQRKVLRIDGLPQVLPTALERGREAYQAAHKCMRQALFTS